MKKVAQIRYYGNPKSGEETNDKNSPNTLTKDNFNQQLKKYGNILQIGIQSFPGAGFKLNESGDLVLIGATGVYELDIGNLIDINQIEIADSTLELINDSNGSLYVIIDILYEEVNG